MLDEALVVADVGKRQALMSDIEQILQDSGVIIQPYWRSLYNHTAKNVHGARMHTRLSNIILKKSGSAEV